MASGLEAQGDWADLSNQRISLIDPLFSTRTQTDAIGLFTGQYRLRLESSAVLCKGRCGGDEQPLQRPT